MTRTLIDDSEYEVSETEIAHTPTGASWTWYPGSRDEMYAFEHTRGLGNRLPDGRDYYPGDVREGALRARRAWLLRR